MTATVLAFQAEKLFHTNYAFTLANSIPRGESSLYFYLRGTLDKFSPLHPTDITFVIQITNKYKLDYSNTYILYFFSLTEYSSYHLRFLFSE